MLATSLHEVLFKVIELLPKMSENIVDDTRHEKVLSFLQMHSTELIQLFTASGPDSKSSTIVHMFEKCLVHLDPRVTSVSLRLMATLIASSDLAEDKNGEIVECIVQKLFTFSLNHLSFNVEPLLICSCLKFLQSMLLYRNANFRIAQEDLLEKVLELVSHPSYFVCQESCYFLSSLWVQVHSDDDRKQANACFDNLPSNLIEKSPRAFIETLNSIVKSEPFPHICNQLEGVWISYTWKCTLLTNERIVQQLAISLLCELTQCSPFPIIFKLIPSSQQEEISSNDLIDLLEQIFFPFLSDYLNPQTLKQHLSILRIPMLAIAHSDMANSGFILLLGNIISSFLVDRMDLEGCTHWEGFGENSRNWINIVESFKMNLENHQKFGIAHISLELLCEYLVLTGIRLKEEDIVYMDNLSSSLLQLSIEIISPLIPSLCQLFQTIFCFPQYCNQELKGEVFDWHLQLLRSPIIPVNKKKIVMDSVFNMMESRENTDIFLKEFGSSTMNVIKNMLFDMEWSLRDCTLELIAKFLSLNIEIINELLKKKDIMKLVITKVQDSESFVQATALKVIQKVVTSPCLNNYFGDDGILKRFWTDMAPKLFHSSDVIVKMGMLDVISSVINSSKNTRQIAIDMLTRNEIGEAIKVLQRDDDFEVRSRIVILFSSLWEIKEPMEGLDSPWWWSSEVIDKIFQMAHDPSRCVRKEVYNFLNELRFNNGFSGSSIDTNEKGLENFSKMRKYTRLFDQAKHVVNEKLKDVDWGRLEESIVEEHLYLEALEFELKDTSLLHEVSNRNSGNNILECY